MSGTGYTDPRYVKTAVCSKCEGLKTWNYWYHEDDTLCADCYYSGAKYFEIPKDVAVSLEKKINNGLSGYAEVIEFVKAYIEIERTVADGNFDNAKSTEAEIYEDGRRDAFDYALQIIKTEMGRRGLK